MCNDINLVDDNIKAPDKMDVTKCATVNAGNIRYIQIDNY